LSAIGFPWPTLGEGVIAAGIAALARDPAPDRRLAALALALGLWRQADARRRRVLEAAALAILSGLDYFARVEFAHDQLPGQDIPASVLDFLNRHDPTLCLGVGAAAGAAA
jgi:hypothetical protein